MGANPAYSRSSALRPRRSSLAKKAQQFRPRWCREVDDVTKTSTVLFMTMSFCSVARWCNAPVVERDRLLFADCILGVFRIGRNLPTVPGPYSVVQQMTRCWTNSVTLSTRHDRPRRFVRSLEAVPEHLQQYPRIVLRMWPAVADASAELGH